MTAKEKDPILESEPVSPKASLEGASISKAEGYRSRGGSGRSEQDSDTVEEGCVCESMCQSGQGSRSSL
ncbi:MAG: hypothetical protein R3F23_04080 [Verrucomicrobiia bacterium]